MEHLVRFESGYDCIIFKCRHGAKACAPGKGGSHGKHGLSLRFIAKGELGAVQFLVYTGWMPQKVSPSSIGYRDVKDWGGDLMPADLGCYSKTPHYDGQTPIENSCEYCDGQPCYYDGSGLNASDAMYSLVNGGEAALWKFLDDYYSSVFLGGEYPKPFEYPMDAR